MQVIVLNVNLSNVYTQVHPPIKVLELRNYRLEPGTQDRFIRYFNQHFVEPMKKLGGYTLGEFTVAECQDQFVWLRGFVNRQERYAFLTEFYTQSETWKQYGPAANAMMVNSDNVYLLKPLSVTGNESEEVLTVDQRAFPVSDKVVVIDFYIANGRRHELTALFVQEYLPWLASMGSAVSAWVSDLVENDFPLLPTFQDKNLLVTLSSFPTEEVRKVNRVEIDTTISTELRRKLQEVVTIHHQMILTAVPDHLLVR